MTKNDILYTPWRMEYLTSGGPSNECIFCRARDIDDPALAFVLYRGKTNLIMLNLYPYANGHIMLAPFEHLASPEEAPNEVLFEQSILLQHTLRILRETYHPNGFNIGMNIGKAGGAGFEAHFHLHVVPRWLGDTNFMYTIARTRLIPETVAQTYERLLPYFSDISLEE